MENKKFRSKRRNAIAGKTLVYVILLIITAAMIVPFLWMLSASIKSNREVFLMDPFVWIPEQPRMEVNISGSTVIRSICMVGIFLCFDFTECKDTDKSGAKPKQIEKAPSI